MKKRQYSDQSPLFGVPMLLGSRRPLTVINLCTSVLSFLLCGKFLLLLVYSLAYKASLVESVSRSQGIKNALYDVRKANSII